MGEEKTRPDATASPRARKARGTIYLSASRCKGCGFCVEYCPKDVLALSDRFNRKGYHPPEAVREEECVHCGLCESICPDFAIFTVRADSNGRRAAVPGKEARK